MVTVLFPYFIIGYLSYYGVWSEMDVFPLTMLGIYIGLHVVVVVIGISAFRINWWLWHIVPTAQMSTFGTLEPFTRRMYAFYESVRWFGNVKDIVLQELGADIGLVVLEYLKAMYDADLNADDAGRAI